MPKLILICGLSFAGKSTLARHIADRFGYPEVDVDETKVDLFGATVTDDALERADWERIYGDTDRRIADHLGAGQTVIDASRNFSRAERDTARAMCEAHGADLVTVFVDTPEHVARQRLLANRRSRCAGRVTDEDFADIIAAWEPPAADEHPIALRFGDDVSTWLERNADALGGASSAT
jgi:predicted kinase